MNTRLRLKWRLVGTAFLVLATCLLSTQAAAATLDAKAARSLISDRTWQMKLGSGHAFWSWKSDGSVCLRVDDANSECADTGTWKLEGERLCYELTWWGKSGGYDTACFRISDQGKGRYGALQDNGLNLFEFTVAK